MSLTDFQKATNVSRETLERLEKYAELLLKWNPAINLVSKSTLKDLWSRHMLDSAQIFSLAPKTATRWVDLGSGGGFPGLVVAAMAKESRPDLCVTLVESDQRKAAFLRTVSRELALDTQILSQRIEDLTEISADVVSARALAGLPRLLSWSETLLRPGGVCLFPKGATVEKEIQEALASWSFVAEKFPSRTDSNATILRIGEFRRV